MSIWSRATRIAGAGAAALVLTTTVAEGQLGRTKADIDDFTCRELLALRDEERDRALVYFNGYLDGTYKSTTWDAEVVGKRIDRVIGICKGTPTRTVLDAFRSVWAP